MNHFLHSVILHRYFFLFKYSAHLQKTSNSWALNKHNPKKINDKNVEFSILIY